MKTTYIDRGSGTELIWRRADEKLNEEEAGRKTGGISPVEKNKITRSGETYRKSKLKRIAKVRNRKGETIDEITFQQ
jgi:hypothetical protein